MHCRRMLNSNKKHCTGIYLRISPLLWISKFYCYTTRLPFICFFTLFLVIRFFFSYTFKVFVKLRFTFICINSTMASPWKYDRAMHSASRLVTKLDVESRRWTGAVPLTTWDKKTWILHSSKVDNANTILKAIKILGTEEWITGLNVKRMNKVVKFTHSNHDVYSSHRFQLRKSYE